MTKLDTLTPEQEALLPQIAQKWIDIGLSTEPADRATAEAGVRLAYEAAGLAPPRFVVWLGSPLAGAWGQAFAPIVAAEALRGQVRDQVRGQVYDQVRGQVYGQVRDQVSDQVRDQVSDQVYDQVRDQVSDQASDYWRSLIDPWYSIGWTAWFDAFARLGVTGTEPWTGMDMVGRSADWFWAYADIAVLTDRPSELQRDSQGRLHSETGPAIAYRDGWALHFWHGTPVPADLVETGWTVQQILDETNAEVRRCAIERMGWAEFITHGSFDQIGEAVDDPGNPGQELTLYEVPRDLLGTPVRLLVCTNGTPEHDGTRHTFGLTVPTTCKTPLAAAAWTFDLPVKQYALLARAT